MYLGPAVAWGILEVGDINREDTLVGGTARRDAGEGLWRCDNSLNTVSGDIDGNEIERKVGLWVASAEACTAGWRVPGSNKLVGSNLDTWLELAPELAEVVNGALELCDQAIGTVGASKAGKRKIPGVGVVGIVFQDAGRSTGNQEEESVEESEQHFDYCLKVFVKNEGYKI